MSFFVFSDYYRKMCVKLSYIVFVEAIVILLLTFVSMYANGAMSLACGAFAASLILFFLCGVFVLLRELAYSMLKFKMMQGKLYFGVEQIRLCVLILSRIYSMCKLLT